MRACVPSQKRWMSRSEISCGPTLIPLAANLLAANSLAANSLAANPPAVPPPGATPTDFPGSAVTDTATSAAPAAPPLGALLGGASLMHLMTCHGTSESGSHVAAPEARADWSVENVASELRSATCRLLGRRGDMPT